MFKTLGKVLPISSFVFSLPFLTFSTFFVKVSFNEVTFKVIKTDSTLGLSIGELQE